MDRAFFWCGFPGYPTVCCAGLFNSLSLHLCNPLAQEIPSTEPAGTPPLSLVTVVRIPVPPPKPGIKAVGDNPRPAGHAATAVLSCEQEALASPSEGCLDSFLSPRGLSSWNALSGDTLIAPKY